MGRVLANFMKLCCHIIINECFRWLKLVHSLVMHISSVVKEKLLEETRSNLTTTRFDKIQHLSYLCDCPQVTGCMLKRLLFFWSRCFDSACE